MSIFCNECLTWFCSKANKIGEEHKFIWDEEEEKLI